MKSFNIEIIETLVKIIQIEAPDVETAISEVREKYKNEEIVLDADNYLATDIQEFLGDFDD